MIYLKLIQRMEEKYFHNKVIKNLDEFKEYILDYKVPKLGDVEEKIFKIEKEVTKTKVVPKMRMQVK